MWYTRVHVAFNILLWNGSVFSLNEEKFCEIKLTAQCIFGADISSWNSEFIQHEYVFARFFFHARHRVTCFKARNKLRVSCASNNKCTECEAKLKAFSMRLSGWLQKSVHSAAIYRILLIGKRKNYHTEINHKKITTTTLNREFMAFPNEIIRTYCGTNHFQMA